MNKKLVLEEVEPLITTAMTQENPIETPTNTEFGVSSALTQLLKQKWEAIDTINSYIATIKDIPQVNPIILNTLSEIAQDEMIHVGQLEKILPLVDVKADVITNNVENNITPAETGDFLSALDELILR